MTSLGRRVGLSAPSMASGTNLGGRCQNWTELYDTPSMSRELETNC